MSPSLPWPSFLLFRQNRINPHHLLKGLKNHAVHQTTNSKLALLITFLAYANYDAKNSKKVALALVKIDPTLLGQLNYDAKNDLNVVLLAIELSTEHTIHKIWSSVGIDAQFNKEVRAKVKEKYPNFFQDRTFDGAFPNFFQNGTFQGFPSSSSQSTPNQTPHAIAPTRWSEPDDLKDNTSDEANVVRRILKQNHLLDTDLTKTDVSKEIAKGILCQLLELDRNILDKDLKKAYHKAALRIHPDKLKLQSGEEAFKVLTAAYKQTEL